MSNHITIISEPSFFCIKKDKFLTIGNWALFICFSLTLYSPIPLFYYFGDIKFEGKYYVLVSAIYFLIQFLLNQKRLKVVTIRIYRKGTSLYFNDNSVFDANENKRILLYEYLGDPLVNASGNLFLKIKNSDFILFHSVTESQILEIKNKLEIFFLNLLLLKENLVIHSRQGFYLFAIAADYIIFTILSKSSINRFENCPVRSTGEVWQVIVTGLFDFAKIFRSFLKLGCQ